jgi:hypothetical protein
MFPARTLLTFRPLLLSALFLAVLGGKFVLIQHYGSDLPFWDQWDAEADNLIRPEQEGRLTVGHFFSAHNEHRILFTRVLALGLFAANESQWDARVEMVANAALHACFAVLLGLFALELLPAAWSWLYAALIAYCFTAPSAWENTLGGFQSQFYFLLLFSALHLRGTLAAPAWSRAWLLAPLAGLAALFSMASGVMSAAAIVIVLCLRLVRNRRLGAPDLGMLGANAVLVVLAGLIRVVVHNGLQVESAGAWLVAAWHEMSWPTGRRWTAPLNVFPALLLAWEWVRRRRELPGAAVLLGACVWSGLQLVALAYARGAFEHGYSPRYTDLLGTAWLLSLLTLAVLVRPRPGRTPRRAALAGLVLFAGLGCSGLWLQNRQNQREFLDRMPAINQARIDAVRAYVATRDPGFFQRKPYDELPYPKADRLALLLDVPSIRAALPASVAPAPARRQLLSRLALRAVGGGAWLLATAAGLALVSACLTLLPFPSSCPSPPKP